MSKKDYVAIAGLLNEHYLATDGGTRAIVRSIGVAIATYMESDNPKFNWKKFIVACEKQKEDK